MLFVLFFEWDPCHQVRKMPKSTSCSCQYHNVWGHSDSVELTVAMDSEVKVITKVGRERFACHVEDKKLYSWAKLEQSIFFLFLINLFIDLFFFNLF